MDKRFFGLLILFLAFVIPTHAVLKEADLSNTLSILRVELTNYYNDLQDQQQGHKQMRQEVISNLINISRKSSQNALMLYSQKPDYVFDLTYACNEATTAPSCPSAPSSSRLTSKWQDMTVWPTASTRWERETSPRRLPSTATCV